ncbi:MAG: lysophospholipase [Firmicutes bacterium]|nr:lysophospholipase [Bacillota bacterium]
MQKREFTLQSKYDNLALSCAEYTAEGVTQTNAKGVVQIVHGMCEYKERYEDFIDYLTQNGYIVFAHDHRGHGGSVTANENLGYFGDKKGEAIVDDAALGTDEIRRLYPGLSVTLFGHSMGSLVVRAYIQKYEEKIDKLIVCGSPSKNSLAGFGLMLNGVISAFRGKKYRSRLMANASTGGGDDKFPGEGKNAWLTRDKTVVEKYNADEKCNFVFSCNGFSNLLHLVKNAYKKKKYPAKHSDLPIFFMAGADDPVIGSEKKWLAAQQFLRDVGYKNVTGKLYPKMRHEILNELGKEEVYADALAFIEKSAEKQA